MGTAVNVSRADVVEAAHRISGCVERTPLIESEVAGARIWLKCECLQTGGAAALAALLAGKVEAVEGTVVVLSGGNIEPALHARILSEDTRSS